MRIVLFSNSASGNGRATLEAARFDTALRGRGHRVTRLSTADPQRNAALWTALADADLLVVLGGDGTVHSVAGHAMRAGKPLYHVPLGTENLFAREFGMDRRVETLERGIAALDAGRTSDVDVATCNGRTFLLMMSVGPDASVIHRLAKVRNGTISHLSYIGPILAEAARPALGPITVEVDGKRVVDGQAGLLVVANSRQYALRIDPARDAAMNDGLLDVVFFPGGSRVDLLGWALSARLGRHTQSRNLVYERGARVRIEGAGGARDGEASRNAKLAAALPVQLDGEAAGDTAAGLDLGLLGQRLRVVNVN